MNGVTLDRRRPPVSVGALNRLRRLELCFAVSGSPVSALPAEFVTRLRAIYGAAADAVLSTFAADRPVAAWANPLRAPAEDTLRQLASADQPGGPFDLRPTDWLPGAFLLPAGQKRRLTESDFVADGRVYVQNLSSMLAPLVLAPEPGEAALDLAAAPGGKTLHLAARMRLDGALSAVESVRGRFFTLQENLRRGGAGEFVRTFLMDGRDVARKTGPRFNAVLLDAPCTSESRFDARDPATFAFWGPRKIAESARKQKGLLRSALDATLPGGRVLYCTCSLAPEENELVVAHTLRRLKGAVSLKAFDLPDLNLPPPHLPLPNQPIPNQPVPNPLHGLTEWAGKRLPEELALTRRVTPDGVMTGLYLALFEKH